MSEKVFNSLSEVLESLQSKTNWQITFLHLFILCLAFFIFFSLCFIILMPRKKVASGSDKNDGHHIMITGGSSGIGLSLAHRCLSHQKNMKVSHITLVARGLSKLSAAKEALESVQGNKEEKTKIHIISADVSKYEEISKKIDNLITSGVPAPSILFNNAGFSIPTRFTTSDPSLFKRLMDVNYFGTVHTTRAIIPHMIQSPNSKQAIVLTSSGAGQLGIYGYTAYSATKFALRGFSESLQMELWPYNISVQLVFPPNTETPGFEEENKLKMEECRLIEDQAGLFSSDDIAKKMWDEATRKNPSFNVWFGFEGWMLNTLTGGFSPNVTKFWDLYAQCTLTAFFRFVSLFYLKNFEMIVRKCHMKRKNTKI